MTKLPTQARGGEKKNYEQYITGLTLPPSGKEWNIIWSCFLRLFVLDSFHLDVVSDQLVDIRHHRGRLDVHKHERRDYIATKKEATTKSMITFSPKPTKDKTSRYLSSAL